MLCVYYKFAKSVNNCIPHKLDDDTLIQFNGKQVGYVPRLTKRAKFYKCYTVDKLT